MIAISLTTLPPIFMTQPTPRQILVTLLPQLRIAAAYARQIQSQIVAHPDKSADNFFAAALTDADLSIQTFIEVTLLGTFPELRFYGEEYEKSYNTKYFRAIDLGEKDDYLITLDPIDGTQFYLDGHSNYQIILSVLNWDDYEAVIAITPAQDLYYYALRGAGCWSGPLAADLADCQPVEIKATDATLFLGWGMGGMAPHLQDRYRVIEIANAYSKETQVSSVNGLLSGEVAGAALRGGQWIDSAALAFMAQEAGCIVTDLDGKPLAPLHACQDYRRFGLLVAASPTIHRDLLAAVQAGLT
jgi:fructose-1,6-bisphosphatase/inositol monophosphatase family enzyme